MLRPKSNQLKTSGSGHQKSSNLRRLLTQAKQNLSKQPRLFEKLGYNYPIRRGVY